MPSLNFKGKALLPYYHGAVKCIYIDPPYNTGNENWVYNDNVNSPMMQEWLGKVVDREDLTRHDKWLAATGVSCSSSARITRTK
jgi:adenine specific DNA methylase Mod